jgi:hypothetical protein
LAAFLLGGSLWTSFVDGADVDAEAFRESLSDPDWVARGSTISAYLSQLDSEQLPAALEVVEDRRRWMTQDELRLFFIAWARIDAPGCFAAALEWPDYTRNKGAAAALYAWTLVDPNAARDAMEREGDAELRQLLLDRLVAAWAHGSDKEGATEFIAGVAHPKKRDRYTSVLAREFYSEGPDALIAWADALVRGPHPRFGAFAFGKAAGVLAQDDPERAARWVESNSGRAWAFEAPAIVGRHWADDDPIAALGWLRGLQPGHARDRAVAMTFRHWLRESPIEAESWLASQPPDRSIDTARTLLIRQLAPTSRSAAMDVLESISDPLFHEESTVQIAWSWRRTDPAAADAWVEELDLSEESKALISSERPPPRRLDRPRQGSSKTEPLAEEPEPSDQQQPDE